MTPGVQCRIINTALDEFADKDFETTSLNSIIAEAGISKGSMYYYFANKEDLYLYIIDQIMKIKEDFLNKALATSEKPLADMGFFEKLEF